MPLPTLHELYVKLFTTEDKFNFHKTLGIFCLLHFAFRFAQVGERDMGFTSSKATLVCIAVHTLLSVSSLIFKIPYKRIASGYRIWPEYRLHSIVFALRSLSMMLLIWVEKYYDMQPQHHWNAVIVICTLALADLSSWYVGPNGRSNTIREVEAPPMMRYAFSVMQFHATMGVMLGVRRFSTQFIYVWIVQLNAFLMTLRRKNLAPHMGLLCTYGFMLAFGFVVCSHEASTIGAFVMVNTLANTAAVLRLGFRTPKYLLWAGMAALTHVARKTVEEVPMPPLPTPRAWWKFWAKAPAVPLEPSAEPFPYWPALYAASVVGVLCVGYVKISVANEYDKLKAKEAKELKESNRASMEPSGPSCATRAG
ncbi:hypothetical protein AB1Y20_015542 [Prymnesium parvum]|uniref:Transmembrane protein n=1 Tax=Prymnesium parvum TaxID=97485 RepID=A0AB34JYS9_PRYPA